MWDTGEKPLDWSHLALKLDSLPPIICLSGRVDEALQVDREGAGGLKGQLSATNGALDAPTLCQRPIRDIALVLHCEYVLSRPQNAFVYQQLQCDSSAWSRPTGCIKSTHFEDLKCTESVVSRVMMCFFWKPWVALHKGGIYEWEGVWLSAAASC